ncbi:MAG: phage virion morphogenesis protein [Phocaeicola sp.]
MDNNLGQTMLLRLSKAIKRTLQDIKVEGMDEFDMNFRRQGFFTETWQRKKKDDGNPTLINKARLRRSLGATIDPDNCTVSFHSSEVYAAVHNDGKTIKGRGGCTINMPKRQFVGMSPQLEKTIKEIVGENFKEHFSNIQIVMK